MSGVCSLFADKLKLLKLLGTIVAISCASGIVRGEIVLSDAVKTKIRRAVGAYVSDRFYGGVLSGEEKRKENVRFTYIKNLDNQTARSCYEADCGGLFEFFTSIVAPEYAECQQNLGLPDFMKVRAKDVFGFNKLREVRTGAFSFIYVPDGYKLYLHLIEFLINSFIALCRPHIKFPCVNTMSFFRSSANSTFSKHEIRFEEIFRPAFFEKIATLLLPELVPQPKKNP